MNIFKLIIVIFSIVCSTSINAQSISFLDNSYIHTYDKCKVSFANVNSCFNIAYSIILNGFEHQVDSNLWGGPYMSKWQREVIRTIDNISNIRHAKQAYTAR